MTASGTGLDFVVEPVHVAAPATSANLGSGFDCFGLALDRYDEVTAQVRESGLSVTVEGHAAETVTVDETHLVVRAMRATFDRLGQQPAGLSLHCRNHIPHGRGLGSSAAAIVSGVIAARSLVQQGDQLLDDAGVLALCTEIEGHPDNVAACVLGGATIAWMEEGKGRAVRLEPRDISPMLFIPGQSSSTHTARAVLPSTVPHRDAAFNLSRAALLVLALTGQPELLFTATEDRLHQGYRASAMPDSSALVTRLRQAGIAATISGAGSSVLALPTSNEQQLTCPDLAAKDGLRWEIARLDVANGVKVRRGH